LGHFIIISIRQKVFSMIIFSSGSSSAPEMNFKNFEGAYKEPFVTIPYDKPGRKRGEGARPM
jgi:hypothetical protein